MTEDDVKKQLKELSGKAIKDLIWYNKHELDKRLRMITLLETELLNRALQKTQNTDIIPAVYSEKCTVLEVIKDCMPCEVCGNKDHTQYTIMGSENKYFCKCQECENKIPFEVVRKNHD